MRQTPETMKELLVRVKNKLHLKSLVIALSAIVVFTTTYMLILPAFTLDKQEAADQGGIDVVAVETAAETTAEEEAAPEAKTEAAETADEQKAETKADAKSDESGKTEKAEKSDKADVKLLTKKTTITAEKAKDDDFAVSAVVDKDAKVPQDVSITATELGNKTDEEKEIFAQYKKDALAALKEDSADVKAIKSIKLYDISLESDSQEDSVEPEAPVSVKIAYDEGMKVDNADNIRIVHFAAQKNGEEKAVVFDATENKVETTTNANGSKVTEASFDTDGFSTFAVVEVEMLETTYLTADGEKYNISVNYTDDAEIPEGSELVVREILQGTSEYDEYREQTRDALGMNDVKEGEVADNAEAATENDASEEKDEKTASFSIVEEAAQPDLTDLRLFYITIKNGNKEIEPKVPVEVVITYEEPMVTDDGSKLDVVHFTEKGVDVISDVAVSKDGTKVKYEAESFSVYGTAQSTVGAGDYIIYRDHSYSQDYAMNYQNNGNVGRSGITINNGTVYSESNNVVWTFSAVAGGGYRISFVDSNGTTHYLRAQIPNNNNSDGTLSTTTNANDSTTVWNYSNNRLSATANNRTRFLYQTNNGFAINSNGDNIYLAKIQEPATITIHYINEDGEEILASHVLEDSTSSGRTAITDIVPTVAGYTYHNTYIANGTDLRATQIVPELRGAGGGTWEYQEYGQEAYTPFSGETNIYIVYGNPYGSGSGSGGGSGGGDDLNIDTPTAGKLVTPNTDGTFNLSLSITGEKDSGDDAKGANVILIFDTSTSMNATDARDLANTKNVSRLEAAKEAAKAISTQLLGINTREHPDLVEMNFIPFDLKANTASGWYSNSGEYVFVTEDEEFDASQTYYQLDDDEYVEITVTEESFNELKNSLFVRASNDGLNAVIDNAKNVKSGTNWESALREAYTMAEAKKTAESQDGATPDPTYIIFITDGNAARYLDADDNPVGSSESSASTSSNSYYRIHAPYMHATDEARKIVQAGYPFYSIGIYGNVDVLEYLTNFAYTGRSNGNETHPEKTYFPASQTSQLVAALNDIADVISNSLAVAGVDFKDGIATDVTHTALTTNVGSGTLGGVTYRKSGGDTASYTVTTDSSGNATFNIGGNTVSGTVTTISYKKIVDVEGEDPQEQDASAQVYAATYDGKTYYMPIATVSASGDFEWDVSPLGTLEDNATYTVSFTVWPDQDAYDYVTNLNNGIEGYTWDYDSEVEVKTPSESVAYYTNGVSKYPNIVRYPNGTFAAMSNTYQTVDYYVAKTEEVEGETKTTYEKGEPIALDIPDPMVLTGSNFTVTKRWDDSLDQSQLAKLIADAEAQGETYSITLKLSEDGEFYKSYTFEPVWNEDTEEYEWPSQTINIAPALLTSTNPGGTYKTVTIAGTTYYVLNEGHEYVLEEADLDSHFEFITETYHPALVNGVLMNVAFNVNEDDEIVDGSTAEVVGTVPLTTFAGVNTLKGGINIFKRVVDEEENIVEDDSTFKVQVALDHINQQDTQIWFDTYEVNPETGEIIIPTEEQLTHWINTTTGEITETEPSGYKDKVQIIDAEKGIYKNANGVLYGVNGKTPVYDDETNYIGSGGYGNVSGYTNVLDIQDNWMIRIVNVLAGTTYEVTETETNGMQPSYSYWHDNAESDEHIVIGNAASNIRVTNKIVNRKVIVYKTDSEATPNPLNDAEFTINNENLKSGENGVNGYTKVIELPISDTDYDLTETVAPAGYNKLSSPVKVRVASTGVTYQQGTGQPQTAQQDDDGNYVVHVTNSAGQVLPNSGGIGTTIFYILGSLLVIGCGVVLVSRRRMGSDK